MCYIRPKSISPALDSLEKKLSSVTTLRKLVRLSYEQYVEVAGTNMIDVRYWISCQTGQRNENLLPKSYRLQQHMNRGNCQVVVWKEALNTESTVTKGIWLESLDNGLLHVLTTKDEAPRGLPELPVCHCKKSA